MKFNHVYIATIKINAENTLAVLLPNNRKHRLANYSALKLPADVIVLNEKTFYE